MLTRRSLLRRTAAAGVAAFSGMASVLAARYDLVITGGRVIDPVDRLDGSMDVAIRGDRIAAVQPSIAASDADRVIDAHGKLVVPGLIDIHTHTRLEQMPSTCLADGVTSLVDGGSQGADRIEEIIEVARGAPNRVRVLLNVARTGITRPVGEFMDISHANIPLAQQAIERHLDLIVGVKARLSAAVAGANDLEVVRRAQTIVAPFNLPVMVHIGDTVSPLRDILQLLKPGDIVTHVYAPTPHGIFDDDGQLLPEVIAARRRGIWFDIGHGRIAHITWKMAEHALERGFPPDTISSDWSVAGSTDQVFDFPNVLSKFLLLGMPLEQVIACGSANAARVFPAFADRGTLRVGSPADITVLDLQDGSFEFVDNENTIRIGRQKLVASEVVLGGKRVDR